MVNGLTDQYGDKMKFTIKPAADNADEIKKYFSPGERHGMIILNDKGETLWFEDGHKQKREVVLAQVEKLLN